MITFKDYPKPELISETDKRINRAKVGLFRCTINDCGKIFEAIISDIKTGRKVSCGCAIKVAAQRERSATKHDESESIEYIVLSGMKGRCYNPNDSGYKNYGGRGITICERWLDKENGFLNFLQDMGRRPSKNHSIDRIDNDGNYCPENCRWATRDEQNNNQRSNINITYNGKTQNVVQWTRELNINPVTIYSRIDRGWLPEESLIPARPINTDYKKKKSIIDLPSEVEIGILKI